MYALLSSYLSPAASCAESSHLGSAILELRHQTFCVTNRILAAVRGPRCGVELNRAIVDLPRGSVMIGDLLAQ